MKTMYCQSCGMPILDEKEMGFNEDGSKNKDYCVYCFGEGKFRGDMTMNQMIEFCVPHMVNAHPHMSEEEARRNLKEFLPTLKRWKISK
ncbi:zinc ribbon domain-containing protein [Inediibacterium massiliense]|uniref:zinc ribbon domain-containing protein n=1 Tax=Inediibacterium massiliense TaxID=1658111 RepID=UPI0006B4CA42|nr:zinc ribbon domain-containing protein [Inediibacterium massiliense]